MKSLLAVIAFSSGTFVANGFASHQTISRHRRVRASRDDLSLGMALTPIGPFCPFRSTAVTELEPEVMDANKETTPGFAERFSRIQSQMQLGQIPSADTLRKVAGDMDLAIDRWDNLFARLQSTPDFQTREYAKIAEAHLASHGTSSRVISLLVRWQSACLRALADNRPAPVPPPGLDLNAMMEDAKRTALSSSPASNKTPSISAMQAAERITALPFGTEAFESDTVRKEYARLVRDHSSLIEAGATYNEFDSAEKLSFLEQIETIADRWDSFFFRFELMGSLNRDYIDQCEAYLSSMNLTEDEYRQLLKDTHLLMREDAEKEMLDS